MECKAMPRGSGKTTLCETACLWALLYGHREFVALIGSDEDHAADMLDSIKSELENNVLLAEDTGPAQSFDGLDSRGLDNLGIEGEHTTCRGARSAAGGAGGVAQVQSRRQRRRRLWLPTECADAGTIARPWNGAGRLLEQIGQRAGQGGPRAVGTGQHEQGYTGKEEEISF